jgi:hypothetical protein
VNDEHSAFLNRQTGELVTLSREELSATDDKIRGSLLDKIRGSGAFRRFKDALQMNGIEEDWYSFRQKAYGKIAIDWLEDNKISYTKDEDPGGT